MPENRSESPKMTIVTDESTDLSVTIAIVRCRNADYRSYECQTLVAVAGILHKLTFGEVEFLLWKRKDCLVAGR